MTKKVYAVRRGRQTGIFKSWSECQKQISGFSGAEFKSFFNFKDAKAYLQANSQTTFGNAEDYNPKDYDLVIYTDGGCRNHGNKSGDHVHQDDPAAWAGLVLDMTNGCYTSLTGGQFGKTNNYMEITAVLKSLNFVLAKKNPQMKILFICDSKYALRSSDKNWLNEKEKTGFNMPNGEIWVQIYQILPNFSNITWAWTHGHEDNEGNNYVDSLLNKTMDKMMSKN